MKWKVSGNSQQVMVIFAVLMVLVAALNAISASTATGGPGLWLLAAPLVLLLAYGGWRLLQATYISLEGVYFIVTRGSNKTEYPMKETKVTYGRFTYPNMGAYGTIIFVNTPKKCFRVAVPKLLFATEFYTEADGYSYDFLLEELEGRLFSDKLSQSLKDNNMIRLEAKESPFRGAGEQPSIDSPPTVLAGKYGAPFSVELRRTLGILQIMKYSVMFVGAMSLPGLAFPWLERLLGMPYAMYAVTAITVPLLLYGIFRMMKGGSVVYLLQYQNNTISLVNSKKIEAQCTREEATIERGYYIMSTKAGTFTYPVASIKFPGKKPMTLGTYDHSPWGKNGNDMGSPTYIVGPPEFDLYRKSFGLN